MNTTKKLIWSIVGSGMIGGLLGIVPPMYTTASPSISYIEDTIHFQKTSWKSVRLMSTIVDTLTIEERIQKIEEMMSIDANLMSSSSSKHNSSIPLYSYSNAKVSENGKKFIKQYESCVLIAYKLKGESRYTIGYGHVIYEDEDIPHRISKSYADKLFDKDMDKFNASVQTLLSELDHRFVYTQSFIDGLTSLTYNCGPDGVRKTRFWKRMKSCRYDKKNHCINKQDLIYAIEAVKTANISSIYKKGHQNRRKKEHNTMIAEV